MYFVELHAILSRFTAHAFLSDWNSRYWKIEFEGKYISFHTGGRSSVASTSKQAGLGSGWSRVGTAEQIWKQSWRLPLNHWSGWHCYHQSWRLPLIRWSSIWSVHWKQLDKASQANATCLSLFFLTNRFVCPLVLISQLWSWNFTPLQYIGTAKQQVTFTAGVREMLRVAAQDICDHQPATQQS